jgi:hypothetical protein
MARLKQKGQSFILSLVNPERTIEINLQIQVLQRPTGQCCSSKQSLFSFKQSYKTHKHSIWAKIQRF